MSTTDGDDLMATLGEQMIDAGNFRPDPGPLKEHITHGHNACQQGAWQSVIRPAVVAFASQRHVDARNKRAVDEAREICDKMGWDY